MRDDDVKLSRISKLHVDRDGMDAKETLKRRKKFSVTLLCGSDVKKSYTLQVAILTTAIIANKCFPGAVTVVLTEDLIKAKLLPLKYIKSTFGQFLKGILGPDSILDRPSNAENGALLVFGNYAAPNRSLRVTFDGWIGCVGPEKELGRLPEREYCALSGVLCAALAVSELFISFADISPLATRRTVGLSLWRPDLKIDDPEALGKRVQFLPKTLWTLGLGHLGNAYLWSLAMLPYKDPQIVELFLLDFDKIEPENIETSLLFTEKDIFKYKTRMCSEWLESKGFQTRIIERIFDSNIKCREDEPRLAICGFDSNRARRYLNSGGFTRVVESGLGGTKNNFDTISVHTLPNPRPPNELWPDLSPEEEELRVSLQEKAVRQNPGYKDLAEDECGRYALADKSIAVPFVGATASCLVLAEILRLLHEGPSFTDVKLSLAMLDRPTVSKIGKYEPKDLEGISYCDSGDYVEQ